MTKEKTRKDTTRGRDKGAPALHVDALAAALEAKGVRLKRADLYQAAAAAFGYRSANALIAAAEATAPPAATAVARIDVQGVRMLVVRGPSPEREIFAVDGGGTFATAPSGRLVDLRAATTQAGSLPLEHSAGDGIDRKRPPRSGGTRTTDVHFAVVEHEHGVNTYLATTEAGLKERLAVYCRDYWSEVEDECDLDPSTATDDEIVDAYFGAHGSESKVEGSDSIDLPTAPLGKAEKNAVLAGLRLLQEALGRGIGTIDPMIADILLDDGIGAPTQDAIDELCERINIDA